MTKARTFANVWEAITLTSAALRERIERVERKEHYAR